MFPRTEIGYLMQFLVLDKEMDSLNKNKCMNTFYFQTKICFPEQKLSIDAYSFASCLTSILMATGTQELGSFWKYSPEYQLRT